MSLNTPLKNARGLGSAREGVAHWWGQRMSAVALIPLGVWFMFSLVRIAMGGDHALLTQWLGSPLNASLTTVMIAVLFYHSQLGIQVVIEDYVHTEWLKIGSLILQKFAHILLAVAAIFAVLKIAFGG
ncbi:MAG: succinate dehydrogenase, hydrophobic membrane anchor protein [Gammaproteobacteria bacterium]